jgi:hypothetical protein
MTFPTIPLPEEGAAPIRLPVRRGSSAERTRVRLDETSLERIESIRGYVERELDARLSTSMVVRLALHLTGNRLADATAADLTRRVLAVKDGR